MGSSEVSSMSQSIRRNFPYWMIKNFCPAITALYGTAISSDLFAVRAEMLVSEAGLNATDGWCLSVCSVIPLENK